MEKRPENNTKKLTKGVGMALGAAFFVGKKRATAKTCGDKEVSEESNKSLEFRESVPSLSRQQLIDYT